MTIQKLIPNLWFDTEAADAAAFYCSVFKNSKVLRTQYYPEGSNRPTGSVMAVEWELDGTRFVGINGGPQFTFDEAVSFQVDCVDQAEVDYFWEALGGGGSYSQCGWLKDKFGLSWQVQPVEMNDLFDDPDPERAERAMKAMLSMTKLDIAALRAAANG